MKIRYPINNHYELIAYIDDAFKVLFDVRVLAEYYFEHNPLKEHTEAINMSATELVDYLLLHAVARNDRGAISLVSALVERTLQTAVNNAVQAKHIATLGNKDLTGYTVEHR